MIGSVAPGQSGVLQLANAAPLGGALLWLGNSHTQWNGQPVLPLDLGIVGAPGCTLLAEPLVIVGVIANGSGSRRCPSACRRTRLLQKRLYSCRARRSYRPLGAVFSRALALKIQ